ncbi:MAG: hypothetical protein QM697_17260 [Lachnospiraceae bacterium]
MTTNYQLNTTKNSSIKKIIFFTLFLSIGVFIFIMASLMIRVPVYRTIEAEAVYEDDIILLKFPEQEFFVDAPIFVYKKRDDEIQKVTDYLCTPSGICLESYKERDIIEGIVYVDVQVDDINLLQLVFTKGGHI